MPLETPGSGPKTTEPRPSGKPLIAGAAGLVLLGAGVLAFLLSGPEKPSMSASPSKVEEESAPPPVALAAEVPSSLPARPPTNEAKTIAAPVRVAPAEPIVAVDLFTGTQPEIIGRGHDVAYGGGMIQAAKLKEIYEFAKANPTDARPQLIMAADAVNRGWSEFAIGHYTKAFEADPRSRGDPRMQGDLISIAGTQLYGGKAGSAITKIYGASAAPPLVAAAEEARSKGDEKRAQRLADLAAAVAGQN